MSDESDMMAMEAIAKRESKTSVAAARGSNRRFLFFRSNDRTSLVGLVSYLRWIIPLLVALIGTAYMLFEQVVLEEHSALSVHVIRSIFVIGLAGPALIFLILSWAKKIAEAEAAAQRELALRNRELAALNAVGEVAGQSLHLEEILQTALIKTVELIGMQAGEMRIVEGDKLVLKAHYGIAPSQEEEKFVPLGQCVCGQCAKSAQTIAVNNLPAVPVFAKFPCARENFRSVISVPMKSEGKVLGVMLLANRNSDAIASADQRILTAIAYRVAAAVENSRVYGQARRRALHLETSSLVGQQITSLLELDALLAQVVRMIRNRFSFDHVDIFLIDEESRELVLKESSGIGAEQLKQRGLRLRVGEEGVTGWVAHAGQAVLCNDIRREPMYYSSWLVPGTKSELAVPLRVGSRTIGVLDVQSDRYDAFDKEDLTVLQILGNQVGVAIENARLFQETRRRYDAMVALHDISLDIISELDMPKLLESLLGRGALLLGAQASSLFLYDSTREMIRNVANHNTWRDWGGVTLRPGEGLIGQVILTGQPLIINDYQNWDKRSPVFDGMPQTRAVGAPLRWQGEIIGGVVISDVSNARRFDQDDVWLLKQFADLATIAVKNAELHSQIKEFNQELEDKVQARTYELSKAKENIAKQADQLRALLAKTMSIQEQERARIARDMHDGVIQLVTATRYELQATKVVAGESLAPAAREKLNRAHEILEEMRKEIRHVIYDLHPPALDAAGLASTIQKYAETFQGVYGTDCRVQIIGNASRLSPQEEIAIFRIVEEALQNVAAHAAAKSVSIKLEFEPSHLRVAIIDDGHGFDYNQWIQRPNGEHFGLLGMRERVVNLGGTIEIHSEPEQGTRLTFQVPFNQKELENV